MFDNVMFFIELKGFMKQVNQSVSESISSDGAELIDDEFD